MLGVVPGAFPCSAFGPRQFWLDCFPGGVFSWPLFFPGAWLGIWLVWPCSEPVVGSIFPAPRRLLRCRTWWWRGSSCLGTWLVWPCSEPVVGSIVPAPHRPLRCRTWWWRGSSWLGTWLVWPCSEPVVGSMVPAPHRLLRCRTWRWRGSSSSSLKVGGWWRCWRWCEGSLEMVPPKLATIVEAFHKPRTRQLRVMPRRPLFFHLHLACRLSRPFLLLSFLQLLRKVRHTFVPHTLLLHFLQDGLYFQIELKGLKLT